MGRKVEVEQTPTCQPESAVLECRSCGHSKRYQVQLVQSESGWSVLCQSGKIGSAMIDQPNKATATDYTHAKKAFNQVIKEKLSKNPPYHLIEGEKPALPAGGRIVDRDVVFSPELLTRVTEQEAIAYARRDRYWFQQKRDGVRLTVVVRDGNIFGLNKSGQTVKLDARLQSSVKILVESEGIASLMLDGEWEGSGYWVWDLLHYSLKGTCVTEETTQSMPYRMRMGILVQLLTYADEPRWKLMHYVPSARTLQEKISFLKRMKDENAEGICIKDAEAPYRPGRNGQHMKFKFELTASVIVGKKEKENGHRSMGLYVVNGSGRLRYVGDVGVPDKYDLPPMGAVVEVRYLYAHGSDGKLAQAKYFGRVRTDIEAHECTAEQLRVKQEAA